MGRTKSLIGVWHQKQVTASLLKPPSSVLHRQPARSPSRRLYIKLVKMARKNLKTLRKPPTISTTMMPMCWKLCLRQRRLTIQRPRLKSQLSHDSWITKRDDIYYIPREAACLSYATHPRGRLRKRSIPAGSFFSLDIKSFKKDCADFMIPQKSSSLDRCPITFKLWYQ